MEEAYGVGWKTSDFVEASPNELFLACKAFGENEFRYYDFLARLATGKGLKKQPNANGNIAPSDPEKMKAFFNGLKSVYGND